MTQTQPIAPATPTTPTIQPVASAPLDLTFLPESRAALLPFQFRRLLRQYLLDHPQVTLRQVAQALGVTRQAVNQLVGRLDRPSCTERDRPAPKKEAARRRLAELSARVARGESSESAARSLGISLAAAAKLGFRSRVLRPSHGTAARAAGGCRCWRCRHAAGIAVPRGRRADDRARAAVLDWLAWVDPDTGAGLPQARVARLAGVAQGAVSRIARAAAEEAA